MSSGIRPNDKIVIMTRKLCRYEGIFHSLNVEDKTFLVTKVQSFGTEDRPVENFIAPSEKTFDAIRFDAEKVLDLRFVETRLRDPAIVQMQEHRDDFLPEFDNRSRRRFNFSSTGFQPRHSRFQNHPSGRHWDSNQVQRRNWRQANPESVGSFPSRTGGGQGNCLEEFDFQQGISEFSKMKLNDSTEDLESSKSSPEDSPEKGSPDSNDESKAHAYDKQKSFFDKLSNGPEYVHKPRRNVRHHDLSNRNVETFGMDTVSKLYGLKTYGARSGNRYSSRRYSFDRSRTIDATEGEYM